MTTIKNYVEMLIKMLICIFADETKEGGYVAKTINNDYENPDYIEFVGKAIYRKKIDNIELADKVADCVRNLQGGDYYFIVEEYDNNKYTNYYNDYRIPDHILNTYEDGYKYVLEEVNIFGKAKITRKYETRIQGGSWWVEDPDDPDHGWWEHDDDVVEEHERKFERKNVIYLKYVWKKIDGRFFGMTEEEVKAANRPDDLLQLSVYATGLAAFRGHRTTEEIKDDIINWIENYHTFSDICCAWKDQTIGPVGLYVRGQVNLASNIDLWSWRDDAGVRHFDPKGERAEDGIIARKEELDFTLHSHCEFFVVPEKICGFWVTENFAERHPEFTEWLRLQAEKLGVKVYIVSSYRG